MAMPTSLEVCGREWSIADLEQVREEIRRASPPLRTEIARRVCARLEWTDALGRAKLMSCRVALLRLHRGGWIKLPPPRNGNGNGKGLLRQRIDLPSAEALTGSVSDLGTVDLVAVADRESSALWNGLIDRYHYLGYQPLPGAQIRYLIRWQGGVLGAMGFGAAAWKVAARDEWIGWSGSARETHLARVLNQARFLILPWVRVRNLASRVLSLVSRRIAADFEARYGIRPVLLETFVEVPRFQGICYRAANWRCLGQTTGRGKCDRAHSARLPLKDVYVYALQRAFRPLLGVRA
jgi:hypothetical protein